MSTAIDLKDVLATSGDEMPRYTTRRFVVEGGTGPSADRALVEALKASVSYIGSVRTYMGTYLDQAANRFKGTSVVLAAGAFKAAVTEASTSVFSSISGAYSQAKPATPFMIPNSRLKKLATKNRPPQEWYDQVEEGDI
jgi:hypothetical protein